MRPITVLALAALALSPLHAAEKDIFQEQVVPILRERCLSCHNSVDFKGGFSVQRRGELLDAGLVEPGQPDRSPLLDALMPVDGRRAAMPRNGDPLKPDEVAVIRNWIATGADWPEGFEIAEAVIDDFDWWSLKPLVRPAVPWQEGAEPATHAASNSGETSWARTPIDAFILRTLQAQNLTCSAEADRRTLIRRLSFDLTGLPPTPEQVDAYVNDADPLAYEKLVERLLATPQYGERWARHWLDVVKYADTCGYDKDKLRPQAWPYRDYVIRSINNDKPYSRFVQEQIAGDVLFPGTSDGILGLGFVAAGPWDFIGQVEVPEAKIDGQIARHTDRDEMVSNTLNTFCSITIQCCQCHNHKFDPFTQAHYYNLQAVFAAVDRAERPYDLDPQVEVERRRLDAERTQAQARLALIDAEIQREGGPELADVERQIRELQPKVAPQDKRPEYGYHSGIEATQDKPKWVQVDLGREVEIDRIVLRPCHDEFAGIGAGFGFPLRFQIAASPPGQEISDKQQILLANETARDVPHRSLVPFEIQTPEVRTRHLRVTATRLAERKMDYIFALAEVQVFDKAGVNVALQASVTSLDTIEAPSRWSRRNLTDGIFPLPADPEAVARLTRLQTQRQTILDRSHTPERVAERLRLQQTIEAAGKQLAMLPAGKMVYAAATHFAPQGNFLPTQGKPRNVRVLHRGNVQQPRGIAVPGTVPIIPGLEPAFDLPANHSEGERRAALARWLTRDDHPLTWRSIVNRVWQYHFGRGLVESPNDFGRMGKLPTHPELLDWLAVEFRDNGQSFKHLHRLIVTSSVYRQSSAYGPEQAHVDQENRFLWRMNRRHLEAEEVRDAMLAVSGRLNGSMGGPGYYLFVLERPEHSPHYEYHKFNPDDAASHRRSIYRFIVRSQPDPYMTTLDCADSSQSTPLRNETLTALQALSLLNNGFSLTMAQHFAKRLEAEADSPAEQIALAMRLIAGRSPGAAEQTLFADYAKQHGLPSLCRVLFNLSEFVYLD